MKAKPTLCVGEALAAPLGEFLTAEGIDLALATDGAGDVAVVPTGAERQESTAETVYAGGWIACPTALGLAGKLGIASGQVGRLLDHLEVKIRRCSLGCF